MEFIDISLSDREHVLVKAVIRYEKRGLLGAENSNVEFLIPEMNCKWLQELGTVCQLRNGRLYWGFENEDAPHCVFTPRLRCQWQGYWNCFATPHATWEAILNICCAPIKIDARREQCYSQVAWQGQNIRIQMAVSQQMIFKAALRTYTLSHVECYRVFVQWFSSRSFGKFWIHFSGSSILSVIQRMIHVFIRSFLLLSFVSSSYCSRKY